MATRRFESEMDVLRQAARSLGLVAPHRRATLARLAAELQRQARCRTELAAMRGMESIAWCRFLRGLQSAASQRRRPEGSGGPVLVFPIVLDVLVHMPVEQGLLCLQRVLLGRPLTHLAVEWDMSPIAVADRLCREICSLLGLEPPHDGLGLTPVGVPKGPSPALPFTSWAWPEPDPPEPAPHEGQVP